MSDKKTLNAGWDYSGIAHDRRLNNKIIKHMKKGFAMKVIRILTSAMLAVITANSVSNSSAQDIQEAVTICTPPPSGMVAWWPAEGSAVDSVGGNNGTNQNISYAIGKVGLSFALNGTTNGITVPASAALNVSQQGGGGLTIETWINPANLNNLNEWLAGWRNGSGNSGYGAHIKLSQAPGAGSGAGCIVANLMDTSGGGHLLATTPVLQNNVFQHVALTYNQSNGIAAIYVNGAVVAQGNLGSFTPQTSYDFQLGTRASDGNFGENGFGGKMDEVSIYNRALTTNEIAAIYNAGNVGKCAPTITSCVTPPTGLVSWWPGESNGSDVAGSNNGTWAGFGGINAYNSGTAGQAFLFDGTHRDRLDIGNPTNLQLQNFTIEAWIKRSSATVVSLDDNFADGSIAGNGAYIFGYGVGGYGLFLFDAGEVGLTKNSYGDIHVPPVVTDTNWHHVAVTKSTTNVIFYVDGVLLPAPSSYPDTFEFTSSAAIGSRGDGGGNTFFGMVDELSIYNRGLSSNEIQAIYHASSAGKCVTFNPPSISTQPAGKTISVNSQATFSVLASGAQPLIYQWRLNNTNIADATNSILTLSNVQLNKAGNYSVVITNLYGSVASSNALLTVTAPDCAPSPSGLVGWWPAEGNVMDLAKMNINGTVANGVVFTNGEVGSAFRFSGAGGVTISNNPALNPTNSLTIEFWMNRQSVVGSFDPLVKKTDSSQTHGYAIEFSGNSLLFYIYNGAWRSAGGATISIGQWYHVAGVFDLARSNLTLYVNGARAGTVTTITAPIIAATNSLGVGKDPGNPTTRFYNGLIDEVSIYNRALTTNEITAIYAAGITGKCPLLPNPPTITQQPASQSVIVGDVASFNVLATGTQPLIYQWYFKGSILTGATNSSLVLTDTQQAQAGDYSVMVVNAAGPTVSSNATLTVTVPVCTTAPTGLVGWWTGNDTSTDSVYTNHGTLGSGVAFASGKVGDGFWYATNSAGVRIPASPTLDVGTGSGLTIECWGKTLNLTADPLVEWKNSDSSALAVHFWVGGFAGAGTLYANLVDTSGGYHVLQSAGGVIQSNVWQHVAVSYDHTTGIARLFCNGIIVQQQVLGVFTPRTSTDLYLGKRPAPGQDVNNHVGGLDEVSIYNRALTTNEIAAIYAARGAGKCPLPPLIIQQPVSQTVIVGDPVTFNVTAAGVAPLFYQWSFKGNNINGATNSSLVLSDVQPTQAGDYSVTVANIGGLVTSSNATLAVTVPVCTTPPSGLVAWWPGEGNGKDSGGTNNGTLLNGASFISGKVGQAFLFGTTNAGVKVPASPALDVGSGTGMTVEGWVNPADLSKRGPIVEWNNGDTNLVVAWGVHLQILRPDEFSLGSGNLFADVHGTDGQVHWIMAPGGTITANKFQHVALTYDKTTGLATLYRNGSVVAQSYFGQFTPLTTYDFYIGRRPAGDGTLSFPGAIDEISVYNRALTTNEIAAIYAARGAGKCPLPPTVLNVTPPSWYVNEGATVACTVTAVGSPVLTYQWQYGGIDIAGATNTTLILSNVVYAQAGNYSVVVSNPAGLATSSNVLLRVNRAPVADASASESLVISPNGTNATVILNGSHSSDPDGDPLTYAWLHVGDAVPFATGVVASPQLPVGTNNLVLTVNDGMASGSQSFATEVITTSQAVDRLIQLVKNGSGNTQPLIASLRAALASIDRSQPNTAINQLQAFINKVQAQLAPTDPALAAQLIADAQAIIDALNGGSSAVELAVQITAFTHSANNKHHLKINGGKNHTYIVETSTNMVDWVSVGVATQSPDGTFEFDDSAVQDSGARFYRVVSPK